MINLNKIFDAFDKSNVSKDTDDLSLLVDFSEHPLYWIGYFNKVINNYVFFTQYMTKNIKKTSLDVDIENIKKLSEVIIYNKAWNYIKNINLSNSFHIDCLKLKADDVLLESLTSSILFFERLEEYEKCAFLKEIKDKINLLNEEVAKNTKRRKR